MTGPCGMSNATAFETAFLAWAPQNKRLVMGPLLIGVPIDSILLGIVLAQAAYWRLKLEPYERWRMKLFMYYLLVASVVHTALIIAFSWVTFVDGFGDFTTFFHTRLIKGPIIIETLIVVPIEIYYGKRAFRLWGRSKAILAILSIINLASAVLGMINVYTAPDSALTVLTGTFFLPWAVSVMVLDCTTSGLIIAGLIKTRSGTRHGDQLLRRVIRLSAETQLIPSIITIIFILKAALGRYNLELNLICLSALSVPKIQIITCCLVINSRHGLRKSFEEERQRRQNTLEPLELAAPALMTDDSNPSTLLSLQDILGSPRSAASPRIRQPLSSLSMTTSSQSRSQTRSNDKESFPELELAYVHQLPYAGPGDGLSPGSYNPPRSLACLPDPQEPMSFEEMLKMEK